MTRALRATRRTTLFGSVALLGLTASGCDRHSLDPRDPLPAPSTDPPRAAREPDSDADLVAEIVGLISARSAQILAVRRRHRGLRRELAPLTRMHRAHLAALDAPGSPAPAKTAATARRVADRRRVVAAEQRLQQRLGRAVESAESGRLAKLFASMSASVAQHLAALGGEGAP